MKYALLLALGMGWGQINTDCPKGMICVPGTLNYKFTTPDAPIKGGCRQGPIYMECWGDSPSLAELEKRGTPPNKLLNAYIEKHCRVVADDSHFTDTAIHNGGQTTGQIKCDQ